MQLSFPICSTFCNSSRTGASQQIEHTNGATPQFLDCDVSKQLHTCTSAVQTFIHRSEESLRCEIQLCTYTHTPVKRASYLHAMVLLIPQSQPLNTKIMPLLHPPTSVGAAQMMSSSLTREGNSILCRRRLIRQQ